MWQRVVSIATFVVLIASTGIAGAAEGDGPAAPAGASVVREVQAGGAQVYACRTSASGAYAWTLVGPKAVLINNDGTDFGTHAAGPSWTAVDGSTISADGAHPVATIDRPQSVPALLLRVTSSHGDGVLSGVRFVRRALTQGGLPPPSGCDAAHVNATTATRYSAVYTFYR
jgi:Protein of unknown function (DUF3455)